MFLKYHTSLWLGERFYKVEECAKNHYSDNAKTYYSKCPSCDDTRMIRYVGFDGNAYEAECPICKRNGSNKYANKIVLCNWEVHEYIVYKIIAQGPTAVSAYKDGKGYMDSLHLTAFCKIGRCENDYIECYVPSEKKLDQKINDMDVSFASKTGTAKEYAFRKKKDAEEFCKMLKEHDKKRLAQFNETYHTNYEYPY